jgi:hypothetical protein
MRKGCFLFLTLFFLTYLYQGYKTVETYTGDKIDIKVSGKLSDIAGSVLPVLLETPDAAAGAVRHVRRVQRDGNSLFMLCDDRLLHFDISGKFMNRIAGETADENGACIAEYVLNTDLHRVIVIDSRRNISRYDYDGNRISRKRITHPWEKLTAFACHNGYLWASAETYVKDHDRPDTIRIRHDLYQLDAGMNEISRHPLRTADTGRGRIFAGLCVSELLADEDGVYAYAPPTGTEHLLDDTLYIAERKKTPLLFPEGYAGTACIYPVRKGKRYTISTGNNPAGPHFTFCYDHGDFTAYILPDGFTDDFFDTGFITDFQPMDMYNRSYCFVKSGKDLSKKYPERAWNDDQPVLFIVTLQT